MEPLVREACVCGGVRIWGNPRDDKGTWGAEAETPGYVERREALGCLGGGSRAATPGRGGGAPVTRRMGNPEVGRTELPREAPREPAPAGRAQATQGTRGRAAGRGRTGVDFER